MALSLVFVHGWSVTNLDTYGELPLRLKAEAALSGIEISIKEIFLGSYISFHDEVRVNDISRAFRSAVQAELAALIENDSRFICITHSTGGPVIRDWWNKYYNGKDIVCPMRHLIMLAPANHGSALAQLGKGKLSRLKSWWNGVEPGAGVLNWLALGSKEAWQLNEDWINTKENVIGKSGIFPFVITGQDIDRQFYDHLNPYTGELGSDGVVRTASANLQSRLIKLAQPTPQRNEEGKLITGDFQVIDEINSPASPLRVLRNKSHSGNEKGIMKSIRRQTANDAGSETIKAIIDCIRVKTIENYKELIQRFENETMDVQREEQLEEQRGGLFAHERYFIHDRFSMVIFHVHDQEGFPLNDFDLILTAGIDSDPDHLPEGFCADRQRNALHNDMITYFFNYDIMIGCAPVYSSEGKLIRGEIKGSEMLGLEIRPRPDKGFVRYIPCRIKASVDMLNRALVPNSTTLIDICLQRVVDKQVFRSSRLGDNMPGPDEGEFSGLSPGMDFID
ncbi:phospholipase [soil metagenome]